MVLIITMQFTGCGEEDEPSFLPTAEFTYTGTNNMSAPTEVQFTNTIEIDVEYNWDFGNGETGFGRDPIITYTEEGNYVVTLTATSLEGEGESQVSHEIEIGPFSVSSDHLQGVWSVVHEEIYMPGESNPIIHEYPMNWETLEYQSTGDFNRISAVWVESEYGTYEVVNNVLTQTTTDENGNTNSIDILITAYSDTEVEAEVSLEEPGVGTILNKVLLRRNGPEYFGIGPFPRPSVGDFFVTKWSILEETMTISAYSESEDDYTDLITSETVQDIPYNYRTVYPGSANLNGGNTLVIDNWENGEYEVMKMMQLRTYTTYWLRDQTDTETALLITNNLDDDNIETYAASFINEEGTTYKVEIRSKLRRGDWSEPTISQSELVGQWTITEKSETQDGVDIESTESTSPPVGFVLDFQNDGQADLGDTNPGSWFMLDECNFVVVSADGDETLVHVADHDASTGMLQLWVVEEKGSYQLTMTLEKL